MESIVGSENSGSANQQAQNLLVESMPIAEISQEQLEFRIAEHCPYDADREFVDRDEDDDMYCDGPGARTRSKMGQETYGKFSSPSFLVQIPFYAQKKESNRKCSVCGKHGRTPSDLLRHMRVHTGERPFPCVGCDKKFKCKRSQLTHQYLTHSITDGLSTHRLQILELKKMRRSPKTVFPVHFDLPSNLENLTKSQISPDLEAVKSTLVVDQDEDTEIVAGDDVSTTNGEVKTTFEGFFSAISNEHKALMTEEEPVNMVRSEEEMNDSYYPDSMGEPINDSLENELSGIDLSSEGAALQEDGDIKTSQDNEPLKVPILRIKTHKCTHCKRQFRSIYTLRYHLRSMHDEKVYLSPALESRLKKRRWLPPHIRLQKPKINLSLGLLLKSRIASEDKTPADNDVSEDLQKQELVVEEPKQNIPSPTTATFPVDEHATSGESEHKREHLEDTRDNELVCETSNVFPATIKTEKQDPVPDETFEEQQYLINTDLNNNNSTLRNILTSKESLFNQLHQYTSTFANQMSGVNSSQSFNKSSCGSYLVPPHIFLPSNSQLDEGLENNKPVSWESLRVTSENVLVTKMEAVHPTTQQKYVLYKCSQCGKAFSGLRAISFHLASHNDNAGKDCDKCGASFKWQNELDSHMECHRSDRKFIPSSQFLPSYYVNPFPIPVLPTGEQAVVPTTGLLSYPFFPMPQQISPLVQPGFFPFFAAAALQTPPQIPLNENPATATVNGGHSPTDLTKDNSEEKNLTQTCSFQCKLCPKTFDRIFSLQRHERIHSGVKACFCKTCGRGFSELRNLRHHIVRFHADTAKMEPLPYRRQPTRVRSSSQRLVSFLKKTAVRILNSIGQSKLDPPASSVKIQTDNSENDPNMQEDLSAQHNSGLEQQHLQQQLNENEPVALSNQIMNGSNEFQESKSIVNYLKVPELEDLPKVKGTAKNLQQTKSSSSASSRPMEVLQDPKRSLLGNRRKGRPFKLSTSNSCNFLSPIADENLFAITQKILNGMPKLNIESPNVFLPPSPAVGAGLPSDLGMPQLSFFSPDMQTNNEPLDMSNAQKENTLLRETKTETNSSNSIPTNNNDNVATNFSSVQQIKDVVSAMNASGKLLQSPDGKCMFPCSYCHRSFSTLSDLNRHMTFHADIRPFKCPYCSYCSRTNSQLKVHMMRHEGIKHYMCQICNYNGVTQSDLNRHLKTRTHLLRSRNICACCGTGFHTRSLSEEHYKSCRLLGGAVGGDPTKTPKDTRMMLENRNRGNRLKHVQKPKDDPVAKKEFFNNLYELGKMGVPFADFLQQNRAVK